MPQETVSDPKLLHPAEIELFDRGTGVKTIPLVGKWNTEGNRVTTGITIFAPGTAIPLHTHNVEETVMVLEGEATAVIGEEEHALVAEDVTWVPSGIPHRFINRGKGTMRIYWVYGGRDVTRTICATGETFEHLSEKDRGAVKA
ncbi:MAG: cupin domain-containing protein [Chloroflexota bacterium]